MTRAIPVLPVLALLAACAGHVSTSGGTADEAAPPAPPAAIWLVGGWIVAEDSSRDRSACEGDSGVIYRADGTFEMLEQSGRWTLDGHTLTTRITESDDGAAKVGSSETARIEPVGSDEAHLRYADGEEAVLLRCPPHS